MAYRINTNISSLVAQRSLGASEEKQSVTLNRLSTGSRITRSADDAAGLAISEKLRGDIRSSRQAERNVSDGVSLIQIAEGGLNELTNILIRLKELSVQSASDTVSDTERGFSDIEFQSLKDELNRITSVTKFNGIRLLDGSGDYFEIQAGIGNDDFEDRIAFDASEADVRTVKLGVDSLGVSSKLKAQEGLDKLDDAISSVAGSRAIIGAVHSRLNSATLNLQFSIENQAAARSRISDADYAKESSENARQNILVQTGTAVLAQANLQSQSALKLLG